MPRNSTRLDDLDRWLEPFLSLMGRKTRRTWAPLYLRGLLGPDERKSLLPMVERLGLSGHDQLQHFVAGPAWDDAPLWKALAQEADRLLGGRDAFLVIDDTALPKKGTLSAGVTRQYCGQLGKRANCQSLVSLTLARNEVPVMVGLRLFLPDEWSSDVDRCVQAGVPDGCMVPKSKGQIALDELDRVQAAGARFGTVLADAGYGTSAAFRHGLDERGLVWAVGIPKTQKIYASDVQLVPPGGRARKLVPDQEPQAAEDVLATRPWRRVTWREGTKGMLAARFAAVRIRVADGAVWTNNRHLPGKEAWLVGEWRSTGECQVLPQQPAAPHLAACSGRCHQGALGLRAGAPAAQGRARPGALRRPVLDRAAPARADDVHRIRLSAASAPRRTKSDEVGGNADPQTGTTTATQPARHPSRHHRQAVRPPHAARPMPALQDTVQATA